MSIEKKEESKPQKPQDEHSVDCLAYAVSELCFVLLPFVVIFITLCYVGKLGHIIFEPEWSIVTAVINGQSIVKLIHVGGIAPKFNRYGVGAIIACIILIGLVPSLTILSLMMTAKEIPLWMGISQICLFLVSLVVFTLVNISQALVEGWNERKK